jgi:hypothetical protein
LLQVIEEESEEGSDNQQVHKSEEERDEFMSEKRNEKKGNAGCLC